MDRKTFEDALVYGGIAVVVDTKQCALPPEWMARPLCKLEFALDFPIPIRDLSVTDQGVNATLNFNGRPYLCNVPFSAILGWTGMGRGAPVVRQSIPKSTPAQRQAGRAGQLAAKKARRALPAGWRVIEGGRDKEPGAA